MNNSSFIKDKWTTRDYLLFLEYLTSNKCSKLIEFNKKIINTKYEMLGINTEVLRNISKCIARGNIESFLDSFKASYFEEFLIYGFVIGYIKDKDLFLKYFNRFLDVVDNWAVCDMCVSSFKVFKSEDLFYLAKDLIETDSEFKQRIGLVIFMDYYLDDNHIDEIISLVFNIHSNYYYVNMAISWLLCSSFIKYRLKILSLIKMQKLPVFVQNKTILKIRDSNRVTKEDKEILKKYIL